MAVVAPHQQITLSIEDCGKIGAHRQLDTLLVCQMLGIYTTHILTRSGDVVSWGKDINSGNMDNGQFGTRNAFLYGPSFVTVTREFSMATPNWPYVLSPQTMIWPSTSMAIAL